MLEMVIFPNYAIVAINPSCTMKTMVTSTDYAMVAMVTSYNDAILAVVTSPR